MLQYKSLTIPLRRRTQQAPRHQSQHRGREFRALEVESCDVYALGEGIKGFGDCVCGEDMGAEGVWVAKEVGEGYGWEGVGIAVGLGVEFHHCCWWEEVFGIGC